MNLEQYIQIHKEHIYGQKLETEGGDSVHIMLYACYSESNGRKMKNKS